MPTPIPDYGYGEGVFLDLFEAIADCEAPEGSQVDEVLTRFQRTYENIKDSKVALEVLITGHPGTGFTFYGPFPKGGAMEIASNFDFAFSDELLDPREATGTTYVLTDDNALEPYQPGDDDAERAADLNERKRD